MAEGQAVAAVRAADGRLDEAGAVAVAPCGNRQHDMARMRAIDRRSRRGLRSADSPLNRLAYERPELFVRE